MARGKLFVISAPSGAGKTTLIAGVLSMFPDMLYSVSCTTRPPRGAEIEGVNYYFLDEGKFQTMTDNQEFLEWKRVHGDFYGTPKKPVEQALSSERKMILDIDVHGALEVLSKIDEAVGIFVTTPSIAVLEQRLRSRSTEAEYSIRTRMRNAVLELQYEGQFKYHIVNDHLDVATKELAGIIRKECGCVGDR